ncbi:MULTISPECIES: glycosyltransferase family 39 protein [Streptomyces]|uniref:glycosyltransferase family 39 protein n=1 Tax=Streptomyces TaxID=1883 RepID=UPI001E3BFAD1|nr:MULTISPECIES: glycosyltransferase family 39 protein [Streptomyces]UFQ19216.1 glycosyltransferase family 39 protein [Streptomyces huasconensis]WCL88836.1 glycosyltransferase family 39 protein [Streptomyces sp. JCM 35825]
MWRDEVVTYDVSRRDLTVLWRTLGDADAVHGLYYLVMHGLFRWSGDIDPLLVLRVPSMLAMGAAAAGVALIGERLAGPRAGTLAGLVFAVLPPVQRFAQEGRSYAMVCALVVWATYALTSTVATEGGRARRAWWLYGALSLVACLLHEFAVLALAAHAVWVPRAARRRWAVASGAVVVVVAPLAVVSERQKAQVDWLYANPWTYAGAVAVCLLGAGCAASLRGRGVGGAPAGVLVRLALPLLVVPTTLLLLCAPVKPLFVDRYVLYGMAGLALLLGAVLDRAPRGGRRRASVAVVAAGAAVAAVLPMTLHMRTPAGRLDDATSAAHAIRAAGREGDAVVYLPLRRRVWSLAVPGAADQLRDIALARSPVASATLYGTEVPAGVIARRMRAEPRIVLVTDPSGGRDEEDAREKVKRALVAERRFETCRAWRGRGARVIVYALPGHC